MNKLIKPTKIFLKA